MPFRPGKGFWVLGLTFLHTHYVVFDMEKQRVGIARSILASANMDYQLNASFLSLAQSEE